MQTWTGWGGVKIAGIEFANAYGNIEFIRDYVRNTDISGQDYEHHIGFRPVITIELFNLDDTYAAKIIQLASALSTYALGNNAIPVYPRYTSTDLGSQLYYNCFIDSDISPTDIANVNAGQSMTLKFRASSLITALPVNYYGQTNNKAIDDAANNIVDASGNQIVFLN